MRILMLSRTYPLPTDNGAKRRILAFAHQISQCHDVTFASLREENPSTALSNESYEAPWQDYVVDLPGKSRYRVALRACFSNRSYDEVKYWSHKFQAIINDLLEKEHFDVIWVNFLNIATYLGRYFKYHQPPTILILDQHNVDELIHSSFLSNSTNIAWKIYSALELVKSRRLQKRWFPRFDVILSVAAEDLQATAQYSDTHTSLWLAPNGVDIEYFRSVAEQNLVAGPPKLVFGASMDVAMNQDAVHWFVGSILPCLKQYIPDIQFWIVGRNPPPSIRRLAKWPGIRVTGSVPDVREYYRQADVFVVPSRLGGGTKLKTLEAMAMGLPIVSTTVGAQGLKVESGRHLYIADDPVVFADRVVELLMDRSKASAMGVEARRIVQQRYSWTNIVSEVDNKLTDLFSQNGI